MNNLNNQLLNSESNCCIDVCKTSFNIDGEEVVNTYKCNQKVFSNADLWKIQKTKRQFTIGTNIIIH